MIVSTLGTSAQFAQTPTRPASTADTPSRTAVEASAKRVAQLAAQFEPLRDLAPGSPITEFARRQQAADALAARIHREVDDFVAQTLTPADLNRGVVERRLQQVLSSVLLEQPKVSVSQQNGRRLAIAYVLSKVGFMGPGGTSVALRMYVERNGHLLLADATGSDFDGYVDLSVTELRSPTPRETWILLSGRLTGANGPNTRMRLYAYNGQGFRTVWMPENVWGVFSVTVGDGSFTVKGDYYRGGRRNERYAIGEDGVYRTPRD